MATQGTFRRGSGRRAAVLGLALLGILVASSALAQWQRLTSDEGGVPEDLGILIHSDNTLGDTLWSASMEKCLYRSVWDDNADQWGAWEEFGPSQMMYGVDAVRIGATEHVLGAGDPGGVWYKQNPHGTTGEWEHPISVPNGYPQIWDKRAWCHDVAFFCNTDGTWPVTPSDSFFVILSYDLNLLGSNYNAGIYRWGGDLIPVDFKRVDASSSTSDGRGFGHFWRDLGDGNVLYVTDDQGGLYKLWGLYSHPNFEKLPAGTKLEDLPVHILR
ncbi:MAG: hypothetical protein C4524_05020 [Candidatus Zixiibacteriota bacterium]|nr:MAG: hypothetical protein C4524_05020 [candidate division Zixibacteria bacterium]